MKLEGVHEGRLYCSDGRQLLVEGPRGDFSPAGTIPVGGGGLERLSGYATTTGPLGRAVERLVGRVATTNVWRFADAFALASLGRRLFVTHDGGDSWTPSWTVPGETGVRGVLPGGVCRHDGAVYLGEYPLAGATPRVLRSTDRCRTWEAVLELPDVRHVHAVQADPYGGDVWVTTGDRDPACRVGRLRDGELDLVGGGEQRWRAVELAFTPSAVLWGVDSAYVDPNELLRLDRADLGADRPEPRRVGTLGSSVYHAASLEGDGDHWVAFATADEVGADSTASGEGAPTGGDGPTVVAASAASEYTDWRSVASFRRRPCLADHARGALPRANAYVFLAAAPERGLLVNPFNAVPGDGTVQEVPADRLASLSARAG